MARDETDALGTFAHNFVCTDEQFLKSTLSPVEILQCLPFVSSEAQIPAPDRSLPVAVLPPEIPSAIDDTSWWPLALYLVSAFLGETTLAVPVIALPQSRTWRLLSHVFSLLPRNEASRLAFSTMFLNATNWLDGFRLVFVPDARCLPGNQRWYRVIDPEKAPQPKPEPLAEFWSDERDLGLTLMQFLNVTSPPCVSQETARACLPSLLATGKKFRAVVEKLRPKRVYPLMMGNAEWLVSFGQAGDGLDSATLTEAVWENPAANLRSAMLATAQIRDTLSERRLLEDLAGFMASGALPVTSLGALDGPAQLNSFFQLASARQKISDPKIRSLAERLIGQPFYAGQLHRAVAEHVLSGIIGGQRMGDEERWLAGQAAHVTSDSLVQSVARLATHRPGQPVSWLALGISESQYQSLMDAAWVVFSSLDEWLSAVYPAPYRTAFFEFCANKMLSLRTESQCEFLSKLAGRTGPAGLENQILVEAIRHLPKAWEVAQYYAAIIARLAVPDLEAIDCLRTIPRPTLFRRFFE